MDFDVCPKYAAKLPRNSARRGVPVRVISRWIESGVGAALESLDSTTGTRSSSGCLLKSTPVGLNIRPENTHDVGELHGLPSGPIVSSIAVWPNPGGAQVQVGASLLFLSSGDIIVTLTDL